ncbi:MAG: hypothetical protein BZY79_02825 [SAR202 cluster bacterium Casp-Chloro-G4]|nr:class I SAM-dependent methyltransferase [Chloroflexota bacterium]PKB61630.1 MAG: hypothetical protein BZY79_02825 [SAR202 cluster bacterium Casp-Chloro-G4]
MDGKNALDLGYSWVWTSGHLVPTAAFAGGVGIAWFFGASVWVWVPLLALAVWALAGLLISKLLIRVNDPMSLPSSEYAASAGKIIDLGCGAGRTSIMVGLGRPQAQITLLDNFSADYIQGHGQEKTLRNFQVAGIEGRITIQEGDFRGLPFDDGSFDAAVSSYAIDHLDPQDIPVALSEARRVLSSDGEFLLMVIVPNIWMAIAYTPAIFHMFRTRGYWRRVLDEAGFQLSSEGSSRGAAWFLLRARGAESSAFEGVRSVSKGRASSADMVRGVLKSHLPQGRGAARFMQATGLAVVTAAIFLQGVQGNISWAWIAIFILVGMHVGVVLLLLAAVTRWLANRKSGQQTSSS